MSSDNSTVKLLVRLQDGALVETVVMRYPNTMGAKKWNGNEGKKE